MGMAASQARFLSLTARKTNVEFEGQQINQQRTTLSNETANYYSKLTNLAVPTPPSSSDYTKTTYTFVDGSETNIVNSLIAQKNGYYILNYTQTTQCNAVVSNGNVIVSRKIPESGDTSNIEYYIGATKLRSLATSPEDYRGGDPYLDSLDEADRRNALILEGQYLSMLQEKYKDQEWFVRYQMTSTGHYEPVFYSKNQIENADYSDSTGASLSAIKSYVYGETTEQREVRNAKARVEQDSSGRYMSVIIYETDENGNILVDADGVEIGTTYTLNATTISDDNAYNDAINQYNYNKSMYDKEIQDINAKIEVIQAQDKDLELRLKQLDTEENAISTEIDAVKKVISKNVDSSFKTFNA